MIPEMFKPNDTHGNMSKMLPLSWPSFHLQTYVILLKEPDQRS